MLNLIFLSHSFNVYFSDASVSCHLGTLEIVWSSPTPDKIIEGKRKDLECHFSGWPLPHEVHWYKDGQLITNETEGIFHSEDKTWKKGEEILWSTLHLPPGREEQEGDYNCSARNSIHGWSSSVSLADEIEMMYECKLCYHTAVQPNSHNYLLGPLLNVSNF